MFGLFVLLLAAGLIAHRGLARRVAGLEAEIESLHARLDVGRAPMAEALPEPSPVRAARRSALAERPVVAVMPPPEMPESPAPAPDVADAPPPGWRDRIGGISFEQVVGGRLPIWVGGAALAVAGFYLVALAIDAGLLDPPVRVMLAMLFGLGLIGLSEGAGRWRLIAADARVAQALAGAGIASLYAAAYLASAVYGLISPWIAIVLMALVTACALGLALRRGAPTAIMGLVGGFAAPLLALGGDAVVPLLAYLGLLSAGLFALAIRRGWTWLSLATAAGSFLWLAALIARDASVAAGGFVLAFAAVAAFALPGTGDASPGRRALLRGVPLAVGLVELAGLIPASGFGIEGWALYLALSAGTIALAVRDPRQTPLVAGALALALVALVAALSAGGAHLSVLGAVGIGLLFGAAGYALGARGRDGAWWAGIGGVALIAPFVLLHLARDALLPHPAWGGVALLLALPPLHLAWRLRGDAREARPFTVALQIAVGAGAVLVALAAGDLLPERLLPAALAAIALGLAFAARAIGDGGVRRQALVAAWLAALAMLFVGHGVAEALWASLAGAHLLWPLLPSPQRAMEGLLLPALLLALAAWRTVGGAARRSLAILAGTGAAAGLYVLAKQPLAIGDPARFVAWGFVERMVLSQILLGAGALLALRGQAAGRWLAVAGVARILWFDLLLLDPAIVPQYVGDWPVANLLTLHFGLAALWVALLWQQASGRARTGWLAAFVAILLGGTLLVARQAFQGGIMAGGAVSRAEFYAYSVAGLAVALGLLGWGARGGDRAMRIAGLGLLTAVSLKVFLVDAAALAGLLRAASFLGLGVALIGIGWAYGRFLGRAAPAERPFSG